MLDRLVEAVVKSLAVEVVLQNRLAYLRLLDGVLVGVLRLYDYRGANLGGQIESSADVRPELVHPEPDPTTLFPILCEGIGEGYFAIIQAIVSIPVTPHHCRQTGRCARGPHHIDDAHRVLSQLTRRAPGVIRMVVPIEIRRLRCRWHAGGGAASLVVRSEEGVGAGHRSSALLPGGISGHSPSASSTPPEPSASLPELWIE